MSTSPSPACQENASLLKIPVMEIESKSIIQNQPHFNTRKWSARIFTLIALALFAVAGYMYTFMAHSSSSSSNASARVYYEAEDYDHDRSNRTLMFSYVYP